MCHKQEHSVIFSLIGTSSDTDGCSSMTKDQLWHRLVGASDLAVAELDCASHPGLLPTSDELKAFGQQTFDLLCTTKGFMSISMQGLKEPGPEGGYHSLGIRHVSNAAHLEPPSSRGALYWPLVEALYWEIDGKPCIADPPKVRFNDMPEEVTAIKAHLMSHMPLVRPNLVPDAAYDHYHCLLKIPLSCQDVFLPDCDVIYFFAYKGNF